MIISPVLLLRAMSESMALLQQESVLMSMAQVTSKGYTDRQLSLVWDDILSVNCIPTNEKFYFIDNGSPK